MTHILTHKPPLHSKCSSDDLAKKAEENHSVNSPTLVQRNDFEESSHRSEGKKHKTIKSQGGILALVVNKDLKVSQIVDLDGCAIVSKFVGQRMVHKTVMEWMDKEWGSSLGYLPICHLLSRGWMGIIFKSKYDVENILAG
jgi:hypothetical protein